MRKIFALALGLTMIFAFVSTSAGFDRVVLFENFTSAT